MWANVGMEDSKFREDNSWRVQMWHQWSWGVLKGKEGACRWKPEHVVIYNKEMLWQKSQPDLRQNRQSVRCEMKWISDPQEDVSRACLPVVPTFFLQRTHQVHIGNATVSHGSGFTVLDIVCLPFLFTFKLVCVCVCFHSWLPPLERCVSPIGNLCCRRKKMYFLVVWLKGNHYPRKYMLTMIFMCFFFLVL